MYDIRVLIGCSSCWILRRFRFALSWGHSAFPSRSVLTVPTLVSRILLKPTGVRAVASMHTARGEGTRSRGLGHSRARLTFSSHDHGE